MQPELQIALLAYLIATASPGPATIGIMATAASHGRSAGLQFAAGVMTISIFWGVCAAFGLGMIMAQFASFLIWVKIVGGLYLLYLAAKAFRSALTPGGASLRKVKDTGFYRQGMAVHLTNPKSVMAWAAIISLGVTAESSLSAIALLLSGCAILGSVVFGGYAILFSTKRMMALYAAARRPIDGLLAAFFGFAGVKLIASQT
ncbi:LysE family translocator [Rhodospirillaceae bacterium KN72]|uniref:LysE family translocator n=1 Tax=Pacificispira spongiicola TaxID=2729598 RepID=A0A7Y0E058_9PROT|nr:LysE family translocator [Pacificispira spongiicola]NMM44794.1 LysE family translocator [Pacificispira spongiicola]